jgi:hypothetical protein
LPQPHKSIVGGPIAVVVAPVAYLVARLYLLLADDSSLRALGNPSGAHAILAGIAGDSPSWVTLVRTTVAVIVPPIAYLGGRQHLAYAGPKLPAAAGLRTGGAHTDVDERRVPVKASAGERFTLTVLVGVTITIVVESIAALRGGIIPLVADDSSLAASSNPTGADAGVASVAPEVAPWIVLVDLAVTIVVPAIAAFYLGEDLTLASAVLPLAASLGSAGAQADPNQIFVSIVAGPCEHLALRIFVCLAITIVVEPVTDLVGCVEVRYTEGALLCAQGLPPRADAQTLGLTGEAASGVALVHLAVAVVVQSVAELLLWEDLVGASTKGAILAASLSLRAGANAEELSIALVARGCQRLPVVIFINISVAVIVAQIANLWFRLDGDADDAFLAAARGAPAGADPLQSGLTQNFLAWTIFVDDTVAVVVHAVAQLWNWHNLAIARPDLACHAGTDPSVAGPHCECVNRPAIAGLHQRQVIVALVGEAIAIVVDVVADLSQCREDWLADELADVGTEPGPLAARPEKSRVAPLTLLFDEVVHVPVAIVVDSVADFVVAGVDPRIFVIAVSTVTAGPQAITILVAVHADIVWRADPHGVGTRVYQTPTAPFVRAIRVFPAIDCTDADVRPRLEEIADLRRADVVALAQLPHAKLGTWVHVLGDLVSSITGGSKVARGTIRTPIVTYISHSHRRVRRDLVLVTSGKEKEA